MTAIVPRLHNATRHIALSSLRDAPVQHHPVAPLASSTYRSLTPTRKLVVLAPWRVTLPKANLNAKNVRKESRDGIRKYIKRTHTHTHTHTCMVSKQHSRVQEVWPVYITTQCHIAKCFRSKQQTSENGPRTPPPSPEASNVEQHGSPSPMHLNPFEYTGLVVKYTGQRKGS